MSTASIDLNTLWEMYHNEMFTPGEMKEFYKIIGYSINGFAEIFEWDSVD
jgi:hypothetical protein